MNHSKVYFDIIDRAKHRGLDKTKYDNYHEIHHIIPKCMGGSNDKDNLVMLTAKEHFVCHLLLEKMYPQEKGLKLAAYKLIHGNKEFLDNIKITTKTIESVKNRAVESLREYGKLRVHGENERRIISEKAKNRWSEYKKDENVLNRIKANIREKTKSAMSKPEIKEKTRVNKNSIWYTNIHTNESMHWYPGDPDVDLSIWRKGRPKMKQSSKQKISDIQKDICYCYNDVLKENRRFKKDSIPDGWVRGRKQEYFRKGAKNNKNC